MRIKSCVCKCFNIHKALRKCYYLTGRVGFQFARQVEIQEYTAIDPAYKCQSLVASARGLSLFRKYGVS